ncbi:hypothetical protein [Streptomyces sp. NPDC086023]|uniref:hypothetical protein n=1 Tax=Streptomyces sp. NPDC086023 TaxID=3365746 RepID=UPI0037D6B9BD
MAQRRSVQRQGLWRILFAALAAVCAVAFGMTASASASGGGTPYADQAARAGLTAAQTKSLQKQVDGYLAKTGGRQSAANEITLPSGGTLTVALPGERKARSLASAGAAFVDCPYYYFCAYQYENYGGTQIREDSCGTHTSIPWAGYGSYINNQTSGTQARLENSSKQVLYYSRGAYAAVPTGVYWTPVYYFNPC